MLKGLLIVADYRFEEEWKEWLAENNIKAVKTDNCSYRLFFKAKKIKKLLKYGRLHDSDIRHIKLAD